MGVAPSERWTTDRIARGETTARWFRGLAIVWTGFTALTFGVIAILGSPGTGAEIARPVYGGGAILSAVFLVLLSWPAARVRLWLDRVLAVLQWQVASGAVIAFTVSAMARQELVQAFGLIGVYLLLNAGFAMAMTLVAGSLRSQYAARDEEEREARYREELQKIVASVRPRARPARPRRAWFGARHSALR